MKQKLWHKSHLGIAIALGLSGVVGFRVGLLPATAALAPSVQWIASDQETDGAIAPKDPLVNTEWQLVEIQSMDDQVGVIRPDDPTQYTMRLNGDGTVNLRLDCNLARGRWSAQAGATDPTTGHFEFGTLAATRALCPAPRLDAQITSQSQNVRSYLLKQGRLYLSLMADGGIYVWEPAVDRTWQTKPDPELEAAILQAFPHYTPDIVELSGELGPARYVYSRVDLNNDGQSEVLAYLLGSPFCGTGGCNLLLFRDTPQGYEQINNFPISRLPLIVSNQQHGGWKDLLRLESGGGVAPSYLRHTFDGQRYIEGERLPVKPTPAGQPYLTGELTFEQGILLPPQSQSSSSD